MTIKNILTVLRDPQTQESVLHSTLHVARGFGAHIAALYVKAPPQIPGQFELLPVDTMEDLLDRFHNEEDRKAEDAYAGYRDFVQREELPERVKAELSRDASVSWESVEGYTPDVVARRGGAFDLVVIGSPAGDTESAAVLTVEAALFATGRPVLIVPPKAPEKLGETVLIGWNRSAQAARAFHTAKPLLLERAKKVRILSVTTGAKEGPSAEDIAENLAWYGIEAEIREFSPDHRSVGTVLLLEADAIGADLVVMGAYTHSRLRQMLLGGVTKYVLANAKMPVFMAH